MQYNSNAPDRRDRALQVVLHVAPMQQTHYSHLLLSLYPDTPRLYCAALMALPWRSAWARVGYTLPLLP